MNDLLKMLSRCVYSNVDGVPNTSADGGVTGVHGWGITPCVLWLHCVLDLLRLENFMYITWKTHQ